MRYRIIGDVIFHNDEELDIDRLVNEGILVPVTEEWEATKPVYGEASEAEYLRGLLFGVVGEETP